MTEMDSTRPLNIHALPDDASATLDGFVVPGLCKKDDQRYTGSLDALGASMHTCGLSLGDIDAGERVGIPSFVTKSNVSTTSCRLVDALIDVPDFSCGVFNELGATTASMLKQVCNIPMKKMEMERYFDPVKDLVYLKGFISSMKVLGYTPNLFGMDTFRFLSRIREPIEYWKRTDNAKTRLTFWLVVNTNGIRTLHGQQAMVAALLALASKGIWDVISYNTLEIKFDTEYPFRLIVYIPNWNNGDMTLGVTDSNPTPIPESQTAFRNYPDEAINWRFLTIDDAAPSTGVIDLTFDPFRVTKIIATDCRDVSWLQQMLDAVKRGSSVDPRNIRYDIVKFKIGYAEGAVVSMDATPL